MADDTEKVDEAMRPPEFGVGMSTAAAPVSREEAAMRSLERREALMTKSMEEQQKALEDSRARQDAIEKERREVEGPMRESLLKSINEPLPKVPVARHTPAPPKFDIQKDMGEYFQSAMMIAALGGLVGRRHATNALNAFAGYMEGARAGAKDRYEQAYKQWEQSTKAAAANAKAETDRYRAIFEQRQASIEQKQAALKLAASEFQNQAMYEASRSSDILHSAQVYQTMLYHQEQMEATRERLTQAHEARMEKRRQQESAVDPGAVQNIVDDYFEFGPSVAFKNVGRGAQGSALLTAARAQINQERITRGVTPEQLAVHWARNRAMGIEEGTVARRSGNFRLANAETLEMLSVAEESLQAVERIDKSVTANRAIRAFLQETGSPEERALGQAINGVINAYSRAISMSGGTVTDREHQRENLPLADSPAAMRASFAVIKKELGAARRSVPRAYKDIEDEYTGRKMPDEAKPDPMGIR